MINYEKLNKFQYEAVMHDKGPALLLAGAGTGKTRTLIYRVAHLIESGVSPESILLLTFTNKAANEMKERAEKMLKEKCGITACTYHSFCVKMLRFYGKMAGISPDFTIISGPDEADIIDIIKSELNFQKLKNMPSASVFASMLSTCVNKRLTLEELLKEQKYWRFRQNERKLLLLREETKKYKEEHNLFNYDDILLKFDQMLTDYSNIARRIEDKKVDSESDREESLQDLERNKEDITILQEMAKDYDSALAFLDATTLDATKSKGNEEDKLVLSTIHSVKGLEYDTVVLLDCIDEILPSARYIGSPEDNEDVRCMYVAVTRAKNTLYMMVPKIALKYGKAIPGDLSRYIEGRDDLYDAYEIKYQS